MKQQKFSLGVLCTVILTGMLHSSCAFCELFHLNAKIQIVSDDRINDLKWNDQYSSAHLELTLDASGKKEERAVAFIAGFYQRPGWTLSRNHQPITGNARGGFSFEGIITREENRFSFEAIGPAGETEKETIEIQIAEWTQEKIDASATSPVKRLLVVPGLGVSYITTTETAVQNYSTIALTAKVGANYLLIPGKLDAGMSFYVTALQLSKSYAVSARYFGFNTRIGYVLPQFDPKWFISLYGGWYYTTMMVTGDVFGFKNLSGPQIYPTVRRVLDNNDVIAVYFKFSPISSSFSLLKLSDREIAGGVAYVHPLPGGHSIAGTFDYSNISLTIAGVALQNNSLTLGAQYGL